MIARQAQHLLPWWKWITIVKITIEKLTRNQARSIEQNLINSNLYEFDENFINSIAEWRDIYDSAINWGSKYMVNNWIRFTWY